MNEASILSVRGLGKRYGPGCGSCATLTGPESSTNVRPQCRSVTALRDVTFDLRLGEILGVVGESGSGKSTLVQCLYFDLDATEGELLVRGNGVPRSVLGLNRAEKRRIRSQFMGMVYQNPLRGLRVDITSGANIAEKLLEAEIFNFGRIRNRAAALLARTEIPPLLFLDEVTSGLDVSVQARVLYLIRELRRELSISMIVVSHDMGVIRLLADRTIVMKNGRIVEKGLTDQILEDPQHAYTQLLVHSTL